MGFLQKLFPNLFEQKRAATLTNTGSFYQFMFGGWRGYQTYSGEKLAQLYSRNELAYSCISKIADVMNDAELIVEKRNSKGDWEKVQGHPLSTLIKKPNMEEIGLDFRKKIVQSEYSLGIVYLRLIRPRPLAVPTAFYILNPNRITPQFNYSQNRLEYFQYTNVLGRIENIAPEDLAIRRRADLTDEFGGLAPLAVAANIIESDENLTDYVNSFLDGADGSAGIPAGILKFASTLSPELAEMKRKMWNKHTSARDVQVLDQNAEFIPVGSKLSEIASGDLREQNESRICSVFGVPTILVGAYVGLKNVTQNATAKSALKDFFLNKISPELKHFREWATWELLPLFEDIDQIKAEKVRCAWDLSQMLALTEDLNETHLRDTTTFRAGAMTLNEYRAKIGLDPDPQGDYYMRISSFTPVLPEQAGIQAALGMVSKLFTTPDKIESGENISPSGQAPTGDGNDENGDEKAIDAIPEPLLLPEKKTFEFDGLTLAREPNAVEKLIDLKSLVSDLDAQSESLETALLKYRDALINQAVSAAKDLESANIHTLTLERNEKLAKFVGNSLQNAYEKGRAQIVREINLQKNLQKSVRNIPEIIPIEFKDLSLDELKEKLSGLSDSVIAKILN